MNTRDTLAFVAATINATVSDMEPISPAAKAALRNFAYNFAINASVADPSISTLDRVEFLKACRVAI
jgi:hypothetical protein